MRTLFYLSPYIFLILPMMGGSTRGKTHEETFVKQEVALGG